MHGIYLRALNIWRPMTVLQHVTMRILRGLGGRILECGCLVGFYETYSGRTVAILDARDSNCSDATHRVGLSWDVDSQAAPIPVRRPPPSSP